jgi:hypothetical protein
MPRTGHKSSERLRIQIDNVQATYFPGDAFTGHVVCKDPSQAALPFSQSVRLKFFGRAKTKYILKTTQGTSIERGRAVFFEQIQVLRDQQSIATLDVGSSGGDTNVQGTCWPFSITIPESSQPGFGSRSECDAFRAEPPFLHTRAGDKNEIDVAKHPLPSIMYYKSSSAMSGKTIEAYIEYVLLAEGLGTKATYPLYIRQRSIADPITDYKMQIRTSEKIIRTPKLLPELADSDLTFRQKSRMVFRPSKTPRYGYTVKVDYPTVIQLEHPKPIPLKIHVVPDLNEQKTTICRDGDLSSLPPVKLVNMEVKIKGDLSIRCPGMMWDTTTNKHHTFEFQFRRAPSPAEIPIVPSTNLLPSSAPAQSMPDHQSSQAESEVAESDRLSMASTLHSASYPQFVSHTADVTEVAQSSVRTWRPLDASTPTGNPLALDGGSHASLLLGSSAASTLANPPVSFKRQIHPTFATYNIHTKYRLRWNLTLECAGEQHDVGGEAPVTILAPSEEQERLKTRQLGTEGVKKNYDDLEAGVESAVQFIGQVLQAVS